MTPLYDPDRLYEEVAFVAYHFGWDRDDVLTMPHRERQRWCEEISQINDRMNDDPSSEGGHRLGRSRGDSGGIVLRNPPESL
ncbi:MULTISPECIES: DUF6760 family protein [Halostella]|uniref:DUF6760 family protein n=1 Tax=Halostella TaxID=1843185 RepID=UPI001080D465|nr:MULTISPECIES: DUF6760 family protein [Halostella]